MPDSGLIRRTPRAINCNFAADGKSVVYSTYLASAAKDTGENNVAVFSINQQTGEPSPIQHADIRAAHPRTFGLDAGARLLVAGSLAPTAKREGDKVVDIPAGLSVFRMGQDGKLDFVRKYDIDVGPFTQWWTGMVQLA